MKILKNVKHNVKMFPRNQDIRQNGDQRTFYNGEKVAINDGYFTNGIYQKRNVFGTCLCVQCIHTPLT